MNFENQLLKNEWFSEKKLEKLQTLELEVEADFKTLLSSLNKELGFGLESRGDSFHVTFITPTESKIISNLSPEQIAELQQIISEIQNGSGVEISGIGIIDGATAENVRSADKEKKTSFLALSIPKLKSFRERLGLAEKDFHITLGFFGGDIHMKAIGKNEKGKDILAPIDKKADSRFDHLSKLIPEIKFSGLTGQEREPTNN